VARSTTILSLRHGGQVVMIGDGQVSRGATVVKGNAVKVRRLRETILVGMAGAAGDCLTLIERLERALDECGGQLLRAAVALAKAWRTEKYLRHLDAVLCVADKDVSLMVAGNGDVIQPEDGIMAVGSGGLYALAAARALVEQPGLDAEAIARKAMTIAADLCVYTNHNVLIEVLTLAADTEDKPKKKDE